MEFGLISIAIIIAVMCLIFNVKTPRLSMNIPTPVLLVFIAIIYLIFEYNK